MELKQIKELMTAMGRTGIRRLAIKKDGFELELEREGNTLLALPEAPFEAIDEQRYRTELALRKANSGLPKNSEQLSSLGHQTGETAVNKDDQSSATFVTSPMVGTFYNSPSPEDPQFVKVGDKIDKNTVVCIIEAMKVMNEVKAGVTGTVAEILVESGHPVEFGTKLFRITI